MPLLLFALTLPWAVGVVWLRLAAWRAPSTAPHWTWTLGNGYFIGIATTCLLLVLTEGLFGTLSIWPVLIILGLLLIAGLVFARVAVPAPGRSSPPPSPECTSLDDPEPFWRRLLLTVLALLIGAHLLFSLVEILVRPMFPWDSWVVWAYRAKAWFYSGELVTMVEPGALAEAWGEVWPAAVDSQLRSFVYGQVATRYPDLVPLTHLWAALGLGRWHESLVNLPVFLCALSVALAFWGQLRMAGLGTVIATAWTYALLSTPIWATHMSLGGYADLWMAAFAGVGFMAMIGAASGGPRAGWWLGLLLLVIAPLVKIEGAVWLLAGLCWVLLVRAQWRWLLGAAAALGLLAALAWLSGNTLVHIPGLGSAGLDGLRVVLPGLGTVTTLAVNDVAAPFLEHALLRGSWHLVWPLGLLILAAVPVARTSGRIRAPLLFLLLFAVLQASIFVFSTEGAWASDATAINRLPLQLYPAVLFSLALLAREVAAGLAPADRAAKAPVVVGVAALAAALAVGAGLFLWLTPDWEGERPAPRTFDPAGLEGVLGGARETSDGWILDDFEDGVVVLSSGPVAIDAGQLSLLRLAMDFDPSLASDPARAPAFFWRRQGQEATVSRLTVERDGLIDLRSRDEWSGTIAEVGLLAFESEAEPVRLRSLALLPLGARESLAQVAGEWFAFEPWAQYSINFLEGGVPEPLVAMPVLVVAWLLLSLLLLTLLTRARPSPRAVALLLLAGWWALDARWLGNRARQFSLSLDEARLAIEQRDALGEMGRFYPWVMRVRDELTGATPRRIVLLPDAGLQDFYGLRSKYQLLPHSVRVMTRGLRPSDLRNADYLLYLGEEAGSGPVRGGSRGASAAAAIPGIPVDLHDRVEQVEATEQGVLFEVRPIER